MKNKLIIVILSLLFTGNIKGQNVDSGKYKNTLSIDIFSVGYSRLFVIKKNLSFGVEGSAGIWGMRYALIPLSYINCE